MSDQPSERASASSTHVFLEGLKSGVWSVFFLVLVGNYLGLGALAL